MTERTANNEQQTGLRVVTKSLMRVQRNDEEMSVHIVRKAVGSVGIGVVREGSTGRVVTMVPRIWAVADAEPQANVETPVSQGEIPVEPATVVAPEPEVAFYRKYTEALLRRYLKMSTEAGRVPSLLGRELFRGHVTSYKVKSFEDVVIFCYDVEKCLKVLNAQERALIKRIALQAYSQGEAAAILGLSLRTCVRAYASALDKLTRELLTAKLMRPECCQ